MADSGETIARCAGHGPAGTLRRRAVLPQTQKSRLGAGFSNPVKDALLDVLADQASHLEHRDLGLAEDFLELGVGVDHALVGSVLQVVGLDVDPQLADDFGAWQGSG